MTNHGVLSRLVTKPGSFNKHLLNINLTHMIVELERYEFWALNEEEPAMQMRGGKTEDMPRSKMQSCPISLAVLEQFFFKFLFLLICLSKPPLISQGPLSMGFLVFHSSAYNPTCVQRLPTLPSVLSFRSKD